jgi:hypothetical protein
MFMQSIEQQVRDYYGLGHEQWLELESQTFDKRIYEYAGRKFWLLELNDHNRDPRYDNNTLKRWKDSYQAIRDPSWPDCDRFEDFSKLPDYIKQECREQHGLDPTRWLDPELPFDQWQSDPNWNYQASELLRLKHIVFDNLEFIRNRRVVDFATHTGVVGGTCLHHNARSVIITNIKLDCLKIADQMLTMLDDDKRHISVHCDIHDQDANRELCAKADTAILAGIMDIVTDHYGILKSIADGGVNCVIIENLNPPSIANNPIPLVYWWQEQAHASWRAYSEDSTPATVGCPNTAWFDFVMKKLGFRKYREQSYQVWESFVDDLTNPQDLFDRKMLVYVK